MGRKKRREAQLKPFCYYCDRDFDDEKVLIQHQKAKHFKCSECNRKLDTATGLVVHMLQVHKETISRVPNASLGRDNPEDIIHGMAGIPQEVINEKQEKLAEERGAAKHQKAAHTVFGMSVMSGFFNQMSSPHGSLPSNLTPSGKGVASNFTGTSFLTNAAPVGPLSNVPGVSHNPYTFSQFLSQMSQNPHAAFSALANGTTFQPNMYVDSSATSPTSILPPNHGVLKSNTLLTAQNALNGSMTQKPAGSNGLPDMSRFRPPATVGNDPITANTTMDPWANPQQTTNIAVASVSAALTTKLGLPSTITMTKQSKLVFQHPDETISPEEMLASHY